MGFVFKMLFKAWSWMLIGLGALVVGAFFFWNGNNGVVPERSDLVEVSGVAQEVVKSWKEKRGVERDVKYEFNIAADDGKTLKVVVPDDKLSENGASQLEGERVTVLLRDGDSDDVWELQLRGVKLVDYETSRKDHVENLAFQAESGPYLAGGGLVVFLLSGFMMTRRRNGA